jgi:hypothetical protein
MRFACWFLLVLAFAIQTPAAEREPGNVADMADRLATGLRVKAPVDVAFCEQVAERVREGRLPAQVVDATYTWAIGRGKKYPFPAFQHVIRIKAAKLGVPL